MMNPDLNKYPSRYLKRCISTVLSLLLALALMSEAFAQSDPQALDIIRVTDSKMQGNSSRSDMVMRIERPDWNREIGIRGWALGRGYSLTLITSPARDKGSAFLKREKEIWNWQPSIDRVIKLPPSMMMQSWMGSDFTNDDLVKESSIVEDYVHKMKGDTIIDGRNAWKIEMIPSENAAVVWGRIEAYIDKDDHIQLLLKYYDEDDFLVNTMILSDIREIGGRIIPTRMEMIPADNEGHKTIIIYKDMEFEVPIEESFFSIQNMKRVR